MSEKRRPGTGSSPKTAGSQSDLAMASDKFTPIMYADDTTLLSTLDDFNGNQITNPNSIQINAELTKVMDWLTVNKLSLNIKKKKNDDF